MFNSKIQLPHNQTQNRQSNAHRNFIRAIFSGIPPGAICHASIYEPAEAGVRTGMNLLLQRGRKKRRYLLSPGKHAPIKIHQAPAIRSRRSRKSAERKRARAHNVPISGHFGYSQLLDIAGLIVPPSHRD